MRAVRTENDLPLHLRGWSVPGSPRGTVLIVHGLGEHIGRYGHVAAQINGAGWRAVGYDQRGHGASGGPRGAVRRGDDLLRDLSRMVDIVRDDAPGLLVLLGHSMGGLVAARFVAEGLGDAPAPWWREVDGLVLSSPLLDPGMNLLQKALLAILEPLWPDLAVGNGVKPERVSCDPDVVRAYREDPLVHDRLTPRLLRFIVDAGRLARRRASAWRVPTLLMWAGDDRVIPARGSAEFAAAAPASVVHSRVWPGLYHEIFNEPERAQVLAELDRWLARRSLHCNSLPLDGARAP